MAVSSRVISRWIVESQSGFGTQSGSVNTRMRPRASTTPRLRAAYAPGAVSSSSVTSAYRRTISTDASVELLSIAMTSNASAGRSWPRSASRHCASVDAALRNGMMTDSWTTRSFLGERCRAPAAARRTYRRRTGPANDDRLAVAQSQAEPEHGKPFLQEIEVLRAREPHALVERPRDPHRLRR